jgi:transcriptional regulator with XRE-family HTH domain
MIDSNILQKIMGSNVKKARMKKKLTQAQLAELAGISIPHMTNIERGKTWLGADLLVKMSSLLDLEPYMLLVDPVSYDAPLEYQLHRQTEEFRDIFQRALKTFSDEVNSQITDTEEKDYQIAHSSRKTDSYNVAEKK